jgi:transposase
VLSLSPATRVFVAVQPIDMRRSFNGLYADVQTVFGQDPLTGHLFLFTNKRRNRVKLIFWDGSGLWVCAKRLERGIFGWPVDEKASVCLRPEELQDAAARPGGQGAPKMVPDLRIPSFWTGLRIWLPAQ